MPSLKYASILLPSGVSTYQRIVFVKYDHISALFLLTIRWMFQTGGEKLRSVGTISLLSCGTVPYVQIESTKMYLIMGSFLCPEQYMNASRAFSQICHTLYRYSTVHKIQAFGKMP